MTFGSVGAEFGSKKPNSAPQVAKRSPKNQNRGQFDRRQLAGRAGGYARSLRRAGAGARARSCDRLSSVAGAPPTVTRALAPGRKRARGALLSAQWGACVGSGAVPIAA